MLNISPHPDVMIDLLTGVWDVAVIKVNFDKVLGVDVGRTAAVINLLSNVLFGVTTDIVLPPDPNVDVFTDMNMKFLTVLVIDLAFAMKVS